MPTKIRLTRRGSRKRPYYWIVVADGRNPRDGNFIEKIGTYDPFATDGEKTSIDAARAENWLRNGAQPSDRVAIFLDRLGLRKKTQRYNPQKASPRAKAQERLNGAQEAPSATASSIQSVAFDEEEKAQARAMIEKLLSEM